MQLHRHHSRRTAPASCTRVEHNYIRLHVNVYYAVARGGEVVLRIVYTSRPYNRHDTYMYVYVRGGTVCIERRYIGGIYYDLKGLCTCIYT